MTERDYKPALLDGLQRILNGEEEMRITGLTNAHHIASAHNQAAVIHQAAASAVQSLRNGHVVLDQLQKTFQDADEATVKALHDGRIIECDPGSAIFLTISAIQHGAMEVNCFEHTEDARRSMHMLLYCLHSAAAFAIMSLANEDIEMQRVKEMRANLSIKMSAKNE